MSSQHDTDRGDLRALVGVLRRRLVLVLLAVLAAVGVAIGLSALQEKTYDATATLLFRPLLLDVQVTGLPLQQQGNPDRDAETNLRLVDTTQVRERAARAAGPGFTPADVDDAISISPAGQSNLVSVTASSTSPRRAQRIANAVARQVVVVRRESVQEQVSGAIASVQRALRATSPRRRGARRGNLAQQRSRPLNRAGTAARRRALQRNLRRLQDLNLVETGDAQVAEGAALPDTPASPKPRRNAIIAGGIGLLLGLALALGAEQFDRRVRRPDELEEAFDLPVLTAVPRSKAYRGPKGWRQGLPGGEAEPFRRLRANLRYYGKRDQTRSVLVTSAEPGSGKTTVAVQLAAAAAAAGQKVLLIEADLRRPALSRVLDLPPDEGLSAALQSEHPIEALKSHLVRPGQQNGSHQLGDGSFSVVLAGEPLTGEPVMDASELLDSPAMESLLTQAHDRYDLTVVDGPPPGLVSDVIPLMHQVDGVIVVSRLGSESQEALGRLRTDLRRLQIQPLGVVANFARLDENPYYRGS